MPVGQAAEVRRGKPGASAPSVIRWRFLVNLACGHTPTTHAQTPSPVMHIMRGVMTVPYGPNSSPHVATGSGRTSALRRSWLSTPISVLPHPSTVSPGSPPPAADWGRSPAGSGSLERGAWAAAGKGGRGEYGVSRGRGWRMTLTEAAGTAGRTHAACLHTHTHTPTRLPDHPRPRRRVSLQHQQRRVKIEVAWVVAAGCCGFGKRQWSWSFAKESCAVQQGFQTGAWSGMLGLIGP